LRRTFGNGEWTRIIAGAVREVMVRRAAEGVNPGGAIGSIGAEQHILSTDAAEEAIVFVPRAALVAVPEMAARKTPVDVDRVVGFAGLEVDHGSVAFGEKLLEAVVNAVVVVVNARRSKLRVKRRGSQSGQSYE